MDKLKLKFRTGMLVHMLYISMAHSFQIHLGTKFREGNLNLPEGKVVVRIDLLVLKIT